MPSAARPKGLPSDSNSPVPSHRYDLRRFLPQPLGTLRPYVAGTGDRQLLRIHPTVRRVRNAKRIQHRPPWQGRAGEFYRRISPRAFDADPGDVAQSRSDGAYKGLLGPPTMGVGSFENDRTPFGYLYHQNVLGGLEPSDELCGSCVGREGRLNLGQLWFLYVLPTKAAYDV